MIKSNELRVGNWFLGGWKNANIPMRVDADHLSTWFGSSAASFPDPNPIPVTPEILVKAGFDDVQDGSFVKNIRYGGRATFEIRIYIPDNSEDRYEYELWGSFDGGSSIQCINGLGKDYGLHQLQNLYFSLTGEELTINL